MRRVGNNWVNVHCANRPNRATARTLQPKAATAEDWTAPSKILKKYAQRIRWWPYEAGQRRLITKSPGNTHLSSGVFKSAGVLSFCG